MITSIPTTIMPKNAGIYSVFASLYNILMITYFCRMLGLSGTRRAVTSIWDCREHASIYGVFASSHNILRRVICADTSVMFSNV